MPKDVNSNLLAAHFHVGHWEVVRGMIASCKRLMGWQSHFNLAGPDVLPIALDWMMRAGELVRGGALTPNPFPSWGTGALPSGRGALSMWAG